MISKKATTWILANTSLIHSCSNCTVRYNSCNGTMKQIEANEGGSCNVSTCQLLDVSHFQDKEKLLLFILSQGTDAYY